MRSNLLPVDDREVREKDRTLTVALLERARSGDPTALDRVFARYYPPVLRYVRVRLGRKLLAKLEVEDIVQDTFAVALESIGRFELQESGALVHWLATLAENQIRGAADYWGAAKRNPALEMSIAGVRSSIASGAFAFDPPAEQDSPSDVFSRQEMVERVNEALEHIAPDQQKVFLLRNVAGASWDYIGKEMGDRTAGAVAMLHARARVALLRILDPGNPSIIDRDRS